MIIAGVISITKLPVAQIPIGRTSDHQRDSDSTRRHVTNHDGLRSAADRARNQRRAQGLMYGSPPAPAAVGQAR